MQESELRDYECHVISAIKRYSKRMQWLLSGSRRVFGSVNENNVSKMDLKSFVKKVMENTKTYRKQQLNFVSIRVTDFEIMWV